jgi:hypothetical protein
MPEFEKEEDVDGGEVKTNFYDSNQSWWPVHQNIHGIQKLTFEKHHFQKFCH